MKNLIKHLSCLLIVLLTGIAFASCSSDNDDDEQTSLLVGTWEATYEDGYMNHYYSYTDRVILNADGTGQGIERYSSTDPYSEPDPYTFHWSYNESTKILTIVEDATYDDDSDTYYYYVSEINATSAILYEYEDGKVDYGDPLVLTRVK